VTKGGFLWRQAEFFFLAASSEMVGTAIFGEFVSEAKFGLQPEEDFLVNCLIRLSGARGRTNT